MEPRDVELVERAQTGDVEAYGELVRRYERRVALEDEPVQLSAREARERQAVLFGSSQAIAFTCATSSGGKTPRTAWPGSVAKAVKALLEEALAPQRDRSQRAVEAAGDLRVRRPLASEQHDLRPQHLACGTV